MPFDPMNYHPPAPPGPPDRPKLSKRQEGILLLSALIFCLLALLTPISADTVVDLWRFAHG